MTTLKTKTSEKNRNSYHSLSHSGEENYASAAEAPATKILASFTTSQQPSRKRKRGEDDELNQNEGFELTKEILSNNTVTVEKSPQSKKRRISVGRPSSESVPFSPQGRRAEPSQAEYPFTSREASNTPRNASKPQETSNTPLNASEPQETSNTPRNASTLLETAGSGHSVYVDPSNASLLFEDITEDEEVWILQCPKFINPKLLIGNSINLSKKCTVKCIKEDGSKIKLDSYPVNNEAETSKINLILPSKEEVLQIKVAELRGKLILTEQVSVPEIDYEALMNTRPEEVSFPSNLKVRHPLLGIDIPDEHTASLRAKKKEKRTNMPSKVHSAPTMEEDIGMSQDLFAGCEEDSYPSPNKKNKIRSNPNPLFPSMDRHEISITNNSYSAEVCSSSVGYQDSPATKSKKKKKRQAEESCSEIEIKAEIPFVESINSPNNSFSKSKNNEVYLENYPFRIQESGTSNVRIPSGDFHSSITVAENNSSTKSKKKKKKHSETSMNETLMNDTQNLLMECKDEPKDPLEWSENPLDNSPITSKKKKKRHSEILRDNLETHDGECKSEPKDPLDLGPDYPADSSSTGKKKKKRHSEILQNNLETLDGEYKSEPRDPLDLGPDYPANSSSTGKKKKKRHSEILQNNLETLDEEYKSEPRDPLDLGPDYPADSSSTGKKKKKRHSEILQNNLETLDGEYKSEPRDPLDLGPDYPTDCLSTGKKKKKRRSEILQDNSETLDGEYKSEPRDPLDLGPGFPVSSPVSTSKRKKNKHSETTINDSEHDVEFKYEPRDPLDLGPDNLEDSSFSSSKKKKEHDGIRLNDSVVLPVVCKKEYDSQDSSFEQGDISSYKSKKNKKKHDKTVDGSENPILIEENLFSSPLTNFNTSQNDESLSKPKKKKRHSQAATSEVSEIFSADVKPSNPTLNESVDGISSKSKKKKRKSEISRYESIDPAAIKVEPANSDVCENEVEPNFGVFNTPTSKSLPSFLDSLASNYEFSTPDSSKSKKKRKKNKVSEEE